MRPRLTNNSAGKGPILTIAPRSAANDHEASSSRGPPPPKEKKLVDPKYTQPVWCPPGLTKTQKRKLQRLRNQDRAEKEAERLRDERFEITHPRILSQVYVPKPTSLVSPVELHSALVLATSAMEIDSSTQEAGENLITEATDPPAKTAGEDLINLTPITQVTYSSWADEVEAADLQEKIARSESSSEVPEISVTLEDGSESESGAVTLQTLEYIPENSETEPNEEEMVDFDASPVRMGINMVYYLPAEFRAPVEDGEISQIDFGPRDAIFEKPKEPVKHLKPLYVRGHINGKPVSRMMVDGGAVVNLMPYSVFKKLQLEDSDLMETNMVLNGFEGKEGIEAKGMISLELTIGSKTLATAFFVADVQGNYNVLLGRDWLHANQCVPSTLHQQLIQWVDDEVEIVRADDSAFIALAEAPVDWQHPNATCLSGRDLSEFDFLSATRDGIVPVSLKPIEDNRLRLHQI